MKLLVAILLLSVIAGLAVTASSCTATFTGTANNEKYVNVTPVEAYTLIEENHNNDEFVILDVRTPAEFAQGYIPGAINIDVQSGNFSEDISRLDNSNTYLVYCRTANRSVSAVTMMLEQGFSNIFHMTGGISQWISLGYPIR